MPKKRQIPFLFSQVLADGSTMWHWKPSPRLRKAGFTNMKLGTDRRAAINAAQDQNDAVRAWEGSKATGDTPIARPVVRVVRFAELLQRYRSSPEYTNLKDSSQREYRTRLNFLHDWAMDGTLPVRDIDKQLVRDLRAGLLESSTFRAASTLRVLRLVLQWAVDNSIIAENPAKAIKIPETPARKTRMDEHVRSAISEAAIEIDLPEVALAIDLGFWTLQRQADILKFNRFAWRELNDLPLPRFTRVLADPRGRVMGFRLHQGKTGAPIDAPVPPMLHDRIMEALRAAGSHHVFAHPNDPKRTLTGRMLQTRFQAAQWVAIANAMSAGDVALADAIDASQYRDLRRTGMIFYRTMGVKVPAITALSGHYVLGKKTIMDTYMPGDTAAAVECVAIGLEGWLAQREQANEAI